VDAIHQSSGERAIFSTAILLTNRITNPRLDEASGRGRRHRLAKRLQEGLGRQSFDHRPD
jgi:hypothetical protein